MEMNIYIYIKINKTTIIEGKSELSMKKEDLNKNKKREKNNQIRCFFNNQKVDVW